MTRKEEIANYCEDMGYPLGSCSSINSIKAITASDAIKWADKTMIEKACRWLLKGGYFVNNTETINDFKKAMEE